MSPLVLAICTAYEAGFGHGSEGRATANPYRLADLDSFEAWEYGHQQGTKRRASEPEGCYGIPTDSELLELLKDAFLKTDSDIRLRDDVAKVLLRYNALNRPAEPTTERCSICGSTAGPTSTHPHLPGYK